MGPEAHAGGLLLLQVCCVRWKRPGRSCRGAYGIEGVRQLDEPAAGAGTARRMLRASLCCGPRGNSAHRGAAARAVRDPLQVGPSAQRSTAVRAMREAHRVSPSAHCGAAVWALSQLVEPHQALWHTLATMMEAARQAMQVRVVAASTVDVWPGVWVVRDMWPECQGCLGVGWDA
eukprot:1139417-Pelagomonas_calceolata.AAC.5